MKETNMIHWIGQIGGKKKKEKEVFKNNFFLNILGQIREELSS